MRQAMNLTYGDLIIVEIALVLYAKDLDLSMQAGQYISELLGKVEYNLSSLRQLAEKPAEPPADTTPTPPAPPLKP